MVSSTKIKACALLLLIVIVLIQTDSIEAKGRGGRIRISKRRWWSSSKRHGHGYGRRGAHGYWGRSTGSTSTHPSFLLITAGLLTMVCLDAGRRSSYGPSDGI